MGFQNPELGGMEFSKICQSEILSADKILLISDGKVCFAATFFFVWSYDPWFRIFWLSKLKNLGNRSGEAILAVFTRNQPKSLGDQNSIFDPRATRSSFPSPDTFLGSLGSSQPLWNLGNFLVIYMGSKNVEIASFGITDSNEQSKFSRFDKAWDDPREPRHV